MPKHSLSSVHRKCISAPHKTTPEAVDSLPLPSDNHRRSHPNLLGCPLQPSHSTEPLTTTEPNEALVMEGLKKATQRGNFLTPLQEKNCLAPLQEKNFLFFFLQKENWYFSTAQPQLEIHRLQATGMASSASRKKFNIKNLQSKIEILIKINFKGWKWQQYFAKTIQNFNLENATHPLEILLFKALITVQNIHHCHLHFSPAAS